MSKLAPNRHLFEINYQREEAKGLISLAIKKIFKLYFITVVHVSRNPSHSPGADDKEHTNGLLSITSKRASVVVLHSNNFFNQPKRSHWFNQNQLRLIRGLLCEEYLLWKEWYCLRLSTFVVKFPYLFCCVSVYDTEFQYYRSIYWISLQPLATWIPFLEAYLTYLFKHTGEKILSSVLKQMWVSTHISL